MILTTGDVAKREENSLWQRSRQLREQDRQAGRAWGNGYRFFWRKRSENAIVRKARTSVRHNT